MSSKGGKTSRMKKRDPGNGKGKGPIFALVKKTGKGIVPEVVPEVVQQEARNEARNEANVQEGKKRASNQPKHHAPKDRVTVAMRRVKILRAAINGQDTTKVAIESGLSPATAACQASRIVNDPQVQQAFGLILEKEGVSDKFLARTIKECLTARQTLFFQKDGIVTDDREVVAWETRRKTAELTAKLKGHLREQTQVDVNIGLMALVVAAMRSEPGAE